ncbi:NAD-dependent epimerase/dehydratase family protein [Candidatus Woesearchaeota archaeon]|nr:NAD-dependent epimerase/dehydratase family protein [Candidatus Woesearchaeota archaeon]
MSVLVLGGNRFMGFFLVQRLLDEGNYVTVLNRGSRKGLFGGKVEELVCNRNDSGRFRAALSGRRFDCVFDMSCYTPSQMRGAIDVFSGSAERYVFVSSVAVYNMGDKLPYTESSPRSGRNPFGSYGEDKAACEDLLFSSHGLPFSIVRPTYVYGPRDYSGRMDRVVELVSGHKTFRIPSSDPRVQFVYVHDVVDALVACFKRDSAVGQPFNVCGDEVIRYSELVGIIGELLGLRPEVALSADTDFPYMEWEMFCDTERSRNELKIKYTPLREGLKETLRYSN